MVIIGLLFSLPTYLFYIFITTVLKNKNIKIAYEKTILIIFVISGVFITTALINGTVWFDLAISYSLSTIIATLFFTMYFKNDEGEV
jgi:biotin transporter BioY